MANILGINRINSTRFYTSNTPLQTEDGLYVNSAYNDIPCYIIKDNVYFGITAERTLQADKSTILSELGLYLYHDGIDSKRNFLGLGNIEILTVPNGGLYFLESAVILTVGSTITINNNGNKLFAEVNYVRGNWDITNKKFTGWFMING